MNDAGTSDAPGDGVLRGPYELHFREYYGLPTDDATLSRASTENGRRVSNGDTRWFGAPLTDAEMELSSKWDSVANHLEAAQKALTQFGNDVAALSMNPDVTKLEVRVQIVTASEADVLKAITPYLPEDIKISFEHVEHGAQDLLDARDELSADLRGLNEGRMDVRSDALRQLIAGGVVPFNLLWSPWNQSIEVFVLPGGSLDAGLTGGLTASNGVPLTVTVQEPDQLSASRDDSPGQVKAGLAISSESCSSNISVFIGSTRYLITAGHCTDQSSTGTVVYHGNGRIGTVTPTRVINFSTGLDTRSFPKSWCEGWDAEHVEDGVGLAA